MDQQTEWPATPLHFLYNNTILWCIHAPQANPPPPSGQTAERTTAITSRVVAASCQKGFRMIGTSCLKW